MKRKQFIGPHCTNTKDCNYSTTELNIILVALVHISLWLYGWFFRPIVGL